jgi:hypothetical protein
MFSHNTQSQSVVIAIKSPLQAMNAVEFYHHHKDSINLSTLQIIVFCSREKPIIAHTIKSIIQKIGCHNIHIIPALPSGKKWWHPLREYFSTIRFRNAASVAISKSLIAPLLILGDYRSQDCRALAGFFPKAKFVLLDDGSATHQIARYRNNTADPALAPMFPKHDFRALRLLLWAGIRIPYIDRVAFFTHYNIRVSANDTIIRNDYSFWRSVLAQKRHTCTSSVLFLGMSHVEKRLTDLDRYLSALRRIGNFYANSDIYYRPHRDETADKLSALGSLGFKVIDPDATPVELALIESDFLPSEIACIASSALDNLAVIFQGRLKLRCFVPEDNYCSPSMRGHFQDIIRHHTEGDLPNMHITRLADLPSP